MNERRDREAIVSGLVDLIDGRYVDREYVASEAWARTRADVIAAIDAPDFEACVVDLVGGLPLSHTRVLLPDVVARIAAVADGPIPPYLQAVHRRGPNWTYLKIPSLTLPAFSRSGLAILEQRTPGRPVIIDLRLNDGGAASSLGEALGVFLGPHRPYLRTDLRRAEHAAPRLLRPFDEVDNTDHHADVEAIESGPIQWRTPSSPVVRVDDPVVVLTGPRCYSCGEVLAQVLREQGGALILGALTAGAVVAAREHDLPGGWSLMMPFAWMTTPAGTELEGRGVFPDQPWDFGDDTQPPPDGQLDEIAALPEHS